MEHHTCHSCRQPLRGRADKRFCNDQCRATYHNKRLVQGKQATRRINQALVRNRNILKQLLQAGRNPVAAETLLQLGYQFAFHTHTQMRKNQVQIHYCYDLGLAERRPGAYTIVLAPVAPEMSPGRVDSA